MAKKLPSEKAVALLRKVQAHILEEPKRFDMDVLTDKVAVDIGGPACGTVGCIAGWAVLLSLPKENFDELVSMRDWRPFEQMLGGMNIWDTARTLLELEVGADFLEDHDDDGAWQDLAKENPDRAFDVQLFYTTGWPEPFRSEFIELTESDKTGQAQLAVARIEHYIQTGK